MLIWARGGVLEDGSVAAILGEFEACLSGGAVWCGDDDRWGAK